VGDTWVTGERVGEIESLSVLPAHRGAGLGTELLDRLEAELAEQGVTDLVLGVLPGNTAALRLYERRGWRPTWLYLSRFARRGGRAFWAASMLGASSFARFSGVGGSCS
jgi:ribosomal protein S18 acetylase RimI-like enzyme